jgi:hypothetical protein
MDGVVSPSVNRRSIPAVLIVYQSKIYALSNQSFLALKSGWVDIIGSGSFVPGSAKYRRGMIAGHSWHTTERSDDGEQVVICQNSMGGC